MMTLWTGFKQQHSTSDGTIGSNEEANIIQKLTEFKAVFTYAINCLRFFVYSEVSAVYSCKGSSVNATHFTNC